MKWLMLAKLVLCMAAAVAVEGCAAKRKIASWIELPTALQADDLGALQERGARLAELREALWQFDLVSGENDSPTLTITLPSPPETAGIKVTAPATPLTLSNVDYPQLLNRYGRQRRDYIDGVCGLFFNRLSEIQSDSNWGRSQFNTLAEFTSLMLGISGAAGDQLAILSGVQLGVNDSLTAAERALLLSPDPHKVYQLVRARQSTLQQPPAMNLSAMDDHLREYARPCTFSGIRDIIDGALETELNSILPDTRLQANARVLANMREILNKVADVDDKVSDIPVVNAGDLYWIFVLTETGSEERTRAVERLPEALRKAVKAAGEGAAQGEMRSALEEFAVANQWVKVYAERSHQDDQRDAELRRQKAAIEADLKAAKASACSEYAKDLETYQGAIDAGTTGATEPTKPEGCPVTSL